ncbi:YbaB/EbfC family nucleoid-associated protein [Kineosporia babensis]|uniref:YbaB/EbfC family nucleoid-associated protein n=1 Tax=Kineosporia babensis TaxID=499548 RepID=A0A9X1SXP8_9ACTN|nr:YbaB/EbfC family nucleoid-associated protein [Kineosporia babensis]MCD5310363.1 YbaB/EbfC family nucleoid-associated protein [Kineosporia babensis]
MGSIPDPWAYNLEDELEQMRELVERIQSQGSATQYSETSRRKILTVTANGRGELVDLAFRGTAYRSLPPAELSHLILETAEKARARGRQAAMDQIAQIAPDAAISPDLFDPKAGFEEFVRAMSEAFDAPATESESKGSS